MAKCDTCHKDMLLVNDCVKNRIVDFPDGTKLPAVPYEKSAIGRCHDCNISPGNYHHPGCDMEQCPRCGGQLISCGCLDEPEDDDISYRDADLFSREQRERLSLY